MTPRQERLMALLTKDDWQYIHYAVQQRIAKAKPQPGEPRTKHSPVFGELEKRVMYFLQAMAYDGG